LRKPDRRATTGGIAKQFDIARARTLRRHGRHYRRARHRPHHHAQQSAPIFMRVRRRGMKPGPRQHRP
jgi:hypothetical protein